MRLGLFWGWPHVWDDNYAFHAVRRSTFIRLQGGIETTLPVLCYRTFGGSSILLPNPLSIAICITMDVEIEIKQAESSSDQYAVSLTVAGVVVRELAPLSQPIAQARLKYLGFAPHPAAVAPACPALHLLFVAAAAAAAGSSTAHAIAPGPSSS
jgi:hypothetical protein